MAACGLAFFAVAGAALAGCAARDGDGPQQSAAPAASENRAGEPASDPAVTTTAAQTSDHETAAATGTTATPPATTGTTATPPATTTATAPPETTATTTTGPPATTTTTAPPETAAATTTTTAPPEAETTTTTTTAPPETPATTTVPPEAVPETGNTAPDEGQPDTAGADQAADNSETSGPSDAAAGEAVPALEGGPPAAEEAAAAEPPGVVTPYEKALAAARRLAPGFVVPNDCRPPPLNSPYSMPNAPRAYRSGIHAGVDFLCSTVGHPVVSVLRGQVVVAAGGYVDPTSSEWNELLAVATALGDTPPYTLAMLSGRYVVVDHGIIGDVGHVVSLYAHLDAVDPGIRVGMRVDAGQRLGGVGNTGTRAGVSGDRYGQLHLHWNFYVDDHYLGAGLSAAETREVYAELFKHATGAAPESSATGSDGTPQQGSGAFAPRPVPAAPGTITPSGRRPLTEPIPFDEALAAAGRLSADVVVPSDCRPVPLDRASALPNAPRTYRSGTHQGIDFGCPALGHPVTAALGGRVVMAVGDFEDPTPLEWNQLLDTAAVLGATPPYTLVMLYGNHVAIDHGIIDGVGHVVSLYAHLDGLEPGIRAGLRVEAGQPLGTIGNSGTYAGASGAVHDQLHLHWELHIDGQYLGVGLSQADTRAVYTALFGGAGD